MHEVSQKLPAVSGSSGRRVVERRPEEGEKQWPGRVFEDDQLSYEEAMLKFVAASEAKETGTPAETAGEKEVETEPASLPERRRLLKKEAEQLQLSAAASGSRTTKTGR